MTHKVSTYFLAAGFSLVAAIVYNFIYPGLLTSFFQDEINQSVISGDYILRVNHLKTETLAIQEAGMLGISASSSNFDSLKAKYRNSLYLDLCIRSKNSPSEGVQVTNLAAASEQDYKLKSYLLNFRLQDFIWLHTKDTIYQPVLIKAVLMPNKDEARVRMVFPVNTSQSVFKYTLKFSDPIWNTGESHFNF